jgi:opacity protein-like surface antigen
MASLQLTDRLAVGGGPIITSGSTSFNPAFFAPGPKDAFGLPTFAYATNARPYWGAGFQIGLFYELSDNWNTGFSYKSPIWQEKWDFNAATPRLVGRQIGIQATLPEIFSWGVAYKGLPNTLIDVDFRYIDYKNTDLFGTKIIDGGLGWRSVFAVALGAQYKATVRLTVRGGYLYNTNPVPAPGTLFNVQAPAIFTNTLTLGASYQLTENVTASLSWMHMFRNSIEGSIFQIPGSSVRLDAQTDILWVGLNVRFGNLKRKPGADGTSPSGLEIPPPSTSSGPTSRQHPARAYSRARRPARMETSACRRLRSRVFPRQQRRLRRFSPPCPNACQAPDSRSHAKRDPRPQASAGQSGHKSSVSEHRDGVGVVHQDRHDRARSTPQSQISIMFSCEFTKGVPRSIEEFGFICRRRGFPPSTFEAPARCRTIRSLG